ncbi:MAG TPA: GNAT family N-acetyltransferase [Gaiellales bacterium]|jgi:GNAT superfamily N-acetyltransferase
MTDDDLLAAFDAQRARLPARVPEGVVAERDGPLLRTTGWPRGGFVEYRDLAGLEGGDLDELIARQLRFSASRGEAFEWKLHAHDLPRDLPERLVAAGLVPDPEEGVAIAAVGAIAVEPQLPAGVRLRDVRARADLARVAELESRVYGEDHAWLAEQLAARIELAPDAQAITLAEAGGDVVSAGWVRLDEGTAFARLNGGATLPQWRGRGVYRALVAHRAALAAARGYRYVQVDASADSRPILERLGFAMVTTTTPYRWTPPG